MPRRTQHDIEVDQAVLALGEAAGEIAKKYNLSSLEYIHMLHRVISLEINMSLRDERRENENG